MRITAMIFATLLIFGTIGIGGILANRSFSDASDLDEISESAGGLDVGISSGRLRAGGAATALVVLASLVLGFAMFAKKTFLPKVAIGIIAFAAFAVFLSPQYETGAHGPASARTIAYVVAVIASLAAAAAMGAHMGVNKNRTIA